MARGRLRYVTLTAAAPAPRFVAREQFGCRPAAGFILARDEGQRLAVGVAHDEARGGFLDGPGRREDCITPRSALGGRVLEFRSKHLGELRPNRTLNLTRRVSIHAPRLGGARLLGRSRGGHGTREGRQPRFRRKRSVQSRSDSVMFSIRSLKIGDTVSDDNVRGGVSRLTASCFVMIIAQSDSDLRRIRAGLSRQRR